MCLMGRVLFSRVHRYECKMTRSSHSPMAEQVVCGTQGNCEGDRVSTCLI